MFQLLHLLLLSPFLFLIRISSASLYGTNTTYCPSSNCNGVTVAYPFWRSDINTKHTCGYVGVECPSSKGGDPIFRLPNDLSYHIKYINYDNQSLTMVDDHVANQICPRPSHNFTLNYFSSFSYSHLDVNLTFHFNCTKIFPSVNETSCIPCLGSGTNHSYVTIGDEQEGLDDWYDSCDEKVVATVIKSEIHDSYTWLRDAMEKGFVLDWKPPSLNCEACEASNGRCGFDMKLREFVCICSDDTFGKNNQCKGKRDPNIGMKVRKGVEASIVLLAIGSIIFLVYACCQKSSFLESLSFWKSRSNNDKQIEAFITQCGFSTPKRYKFFEIKRMTNSFKDELGKGGFGSVFKGMLQDGSLVAVKVLKESKGNGEEFINEVASIGRTSHVNIVALLGFCYEGKKRALVYEFMHNGSLEKFLNHNIPTESRQHLGVEKIFEIAVGIARGLEYLHRGCTTRILHFDIKPHNILLDKDFCPKISDFGLAKIHSREESIMSMVEARGTIGYIAPEVFNRNFGGVSHKSDVYSYGMMVLEMVGGRKNINTRPNHSSEIYFPQWIYKQLEVEEDMRMPIMENEIARKMIIVGLWCIQPNPTERPSTRKVVEMLEGAIEALQVPPNPIFTSPTHLPVTSSIILESSILFE